MLNIKIEIYKITLIINSSGRNIVLFVLSSKYSFQIYEFVYYLVSSFNLVHYLTEENVICKCYVLTFNFPLKICSYYLFTYFIIFITYCHYFDFE